MAAQSLGIKILLGLEIVVSLRVLLFTVPVIISRLMQKVFSAGYIEDWMVLVSTMIAFFYLIVGVSSIAGHRLWKFFHYIAAIVTAMLTFGLLNLISDTHETSIILYVLPTIIALGVALIIAVSGCKKEVKA